MPIQNGEPNPLIQGEDHEEQKGQIGGERHHAVTDAQLLSPVTGGLGRHPYAPGFSNAPRCHRRR